MVHVAVMITLVVAMGSTWPGTGSAIPDEACAHPTPTAPAATAAEALAGESLIQSTKAKLSEEATLTEQGGGDLSQMRTIVPFYVWPKTTTGADGTLSCDSSEWANLAKGGANVIAIINPNSGPVSPDDANYAPYVACMKELRSANVTMIGYVPTKIAAEGPPGYWTQTGMRSLSEVQNMVEMYTGGGDDGLGMVSGIFVDEVSNIWTAKNNWAAQVTCSIEPCTHVQFYKDMFATIRSHTASTTGQPWLIVANSGSPAPMELHDAAGGGADVVVVYEGYMSSWDPARASPPSTCLASLWTKVKGTFGPGPWCRNVPEWDGIDTLKNAAEAGTLGSELSALVYAADGSLGFGTDTVAEAVAGGVKYLYVTDAPVWAPWNKLPAFWCDLLDKMKDPCGVCEPAAECNNWGSGAT